MSLGNRLREARERKGWLQKNAAKKAGISNVTLSQYEKGVRKPDFETLTVLADLYEVSTDWLLGRTNISDDSVNIFFSLITSKEKINEVPMEYRPDLDKYISAFKSGIENILDYANSIDDPKENEMQVKKIMYEILAAITVDGKQIPPTILAFFLENLKTIKNELDNQQTKKE